MEVDMVRLSTIRRVLSLAGVLLVMSGIPAQAQEATLTASAGVAMPTGQLGRETATGWHVGALARFSELPFIPFKGVGFALEVDHARFGKKKDVTQDLEALQTMFAALITYEIQHPRFATVFSAGLGMSSNTIFIMEPRIPDWRLGYLFSWEIEKIQGVGVYGAGIEYLRSDTFQSVRFSVKLGTKFNF
jgi:hypothetical protein